MYISLVVHESTYITAVCHSADALLHGRELGDESLGSRGIYTHFLSSTHFRFIKFALNLDECD